jgi:hypothetical protein
LSLRRLGISLCLGRSKRILQSLYVGLQHQQALEVITGFVAVKPRSWSSEVALTKRQVTNKVSRELQTYSFQPPEAVTPSLNKEYVCESVVPAYNSDCKPAGQVSVAHWQVSVL